MTSKKPTPHKDRKHSTDVEKQERIEMTYRLLSRGQRPAQITAAVSKKCGCSRQTVRRHYLPRAREMQLENLSEIKTVQIGKSLALYLSVLEDPNVSARDRLKSQERIDKLLGLEVQESQVNVNVSGDATITTVDRAAAARTAIAGELAKRGISGPTGNGDRKAISDGNGSA